MTFVAFVVVVNIDVSAADRKSAAVAVAEVVGITITAGFILLILLNIIINGIFRRLNGVLRGVLEQVGGHVPAEGSDIAEGIGWWVMRVAARMMPPAAGRRWLAEAESFLAEAPLSLQCATEAESFLAEEPPSLRHAAVASYVAGAAQVILVSWAGELRRLTRRGPVPR